MSANKMEYNAICSQVEAAVSTKLQLQSEVLNCRVAKGFTLAFPNELAKARVCGANLLLQKYFSSSSERNQKVLSVPSWVSKILSSKSKLEVTSANSGGKAMPGLD